MFPSIHHETRGYPATLLPAIAEDWENKQPLRSEHFSTADIPILGMFRQRLET